MMIRTLLCAVSAVLFLAQTSLGQVRSFAASEQMKIVRATAELIDARYVDATKARAIATALRQSDERWRVARDGDAFAAEATAFLRMLSGDGHLGLSYSTDPIPEQEGAAAFSATEMERWYGPQLNHGIEKIERLPGNIMLLDLRVFPPPSMAGDVFAAAHWERIVPVEGGKMGINARNFDPEVLGSVRIRLLDAASDWEGLDPDHQE